MKGFLLKMKAEGIHKVAFGDLFLEDLKAYRENKLAEVGMKALFPLWKKDTTALSLAFLKDGFKTHICCIDTAKIPKKLIGVNYSISFLDQLPKTVDPCGENGEFHSFCFEGPIFKKKISFNKNGTVTKKYSHNGLEFHYLFSDIGN
jgi:diphthamide synthase (EF-2-diphthine--ammonia ligase)